MHRIYIGYLLPDVEFGRGGRVGGGKRVGGDDLTALPRQTGSGELRK